MIFKYAVKQLKRRPFMTILILFQFAVITLLISMILTKISSYFVTSNLIKKICEGDSYYIQYDISYSIEKDDRAGELSNAFDAEFQPYLDKLNNQEITQEAVPCGLPFFCLQESGICLHNLGHFFCKEA